MKHLFSKLLLISLIFSTSSAFAWWDVGHKLVAKIAYSKLKPEVKTQVDKLVAVLAKDYPSMADFSDMAAWPDELREQQIEAYTHWHYIDTMISLDGTPITTAPDTDNADWAITQIEPVVKNANANPSERARFLAFLVHIVGDLHQPLHNVSLVSKNHPEGDEGGNLYTILDPNDASKTMGLHTLWDGNNGEFANEKHPDIAKIYTTIISQYPESYFGTKVHDLSPDHWTQEGIKLSKDTVYTTKENETPDAQYLSSMNKIAYQQIALAGYRLANLLNTLFANRH